MVYEKKITLNIFIVIGVVYIGVTLVVTNVIIYNRIFVEIFSVVKFNELCSTLYNVIFVIRTFSVAKPYTLVFSKFVFKAI